VKQLPHMASEGRGREGTGRGELGSQAREGEGVDAGRDGGGKGSGTDVDSEGQDDARARNGTRAASAVGVCCGGGGGEVPGSPVEGIPDSPLSVGLDTPQESSGASTPSERFRASDALLMSDIGQLQHVPRMGASRLRAGPGLCQLRPSAL
jgi:hypothetical protein